MTYDPIKRALFEIRYLLKESGSELPPGQLVQRMVQMGYDHESVAAAVRRGLDHKTLGLGEQLKITLVQNDNT